MIHRQLSSRQLSPPTVELPTFEPHLKIHRVMTEHTKSKFNNLIYWQIMYRNMRHLLVVLITRSSIFFHGSVSYLYRNEQVFEILFLTLTYSQPLFFPFFLLLFMNL